MFLNPPCQTVWVGTHFSTDPPFALGFFMAKQYEWKDKDKNILRIIYLSLSNSWVHAKACISWVKYGHKEWFLIFNLPTLIESRKIKLKKMVRIKQEEEVVWKIPEKPNPRLGLGTLDQK